MWLKPRAETSLCLLNHTLLHNDLSLCGGHQRDWNELLESLYFPPGIFPCSFGIHVQQTWHLNTEGKMCITLFDMCFWMSAYRCEKAYDFPWHADRSVREKRTTDGYWHSGRSGHFYVWGENIAKSDISISFDYIIIIYQVINLNALLKCST